MTAKKDQSIDDLLLKSEMGGGITVDTNISHVRDDRDSAVTDAATITGGTQGRRYSRRRSSNLHVPSIGSNPPVNSRGQMLEEGKIVSNIPLAPMGITANPMGSDVDRLSKIKESARTQSNESG